MKPPGRLDRARPGCIASVSHACKNADSGSAGALKRPYRIPETHCGNPLVFCPDSLEILEGRHVEPRKRLDTRDKEYGGVLILPTRRSVRRHMFL